MKLLLLLLIVVVVIGIVYGNFTIERNHQFLQFPQYPILDVPVKLSIDGYIEDINHNDIKMTAKITINTTKADSVQRCFCDVHDTTTLETISPEKINLNQYTCTFDYDFNTYILHSLLSGTGIRCYIYEDYNLYPFQLVYNSTRTIHYIEPIKSKFHFLNILNEAPHMIWLSSIVAMAILVLLIMYPSFVWLYNTGTCLNKKIN